MNREEMALHAHHLDLEDALRAAKEAHRSNPTDETKAELNAVKQAIRGFRYEWRLIREFFTATPSDGDAVAQPAVIKTTTKVRS